MFRRTTFVGVLLLLASASACGRRAIRPAQTDAGAGVPELDSGAVADVAATADAARVEAAPDGDAGAETGGVRACGDIGTGWWPAMVAAADGGRFAVSSSRGGNVQIRSTTDGSLLGSIQVGDADEVVGLLDKGRLLLTRQVHHWTLRRVEDGQIVRALDSDRGWWLAPAGDVYFAPTPARLLSVTGDREIWRLDPASGPSISQVAFSADGRWLVTYDSDLKVRLREATTGAPSLVVELPPHDDSVYQLAVSNDGTVVAANVENVGHVVWRVRDGVRFVIPTAGTDFNEAFLTLSPDGRYVGLTDDDGPHPTVGIVETTAVAAIRTLERQVAMAFLGDGRMLTLSRDSAVTSRDPPEGAPAWTVRPPPGHADHVQALAFSPDGTTLATAAGDATVRLWAQDGTSRALLPANDEMRDVAWSPDGRLLASVGYDVRLGVGDIGQLRLFDPGTGGRLVRTVSVPDSPEAATFAPGGGVVAVATRRAGAYDVHGYAVADGAPLYVVKEVQGPGGFSPDGTLLALPAFRGIQLHRADSGALMREIPYPCPESCTSSRVAFAPDGRKVLASYYGRVVVFDLASGALLYTLSQQEGASLTTFPFGFGKDDLVALVTEVGLSVFSLETGRAVARLDRGQHVGPLAMHPRDRVIATTEEVAGVVRLRCY